MIGPKVEAWLAELCEEMRATLKKLVADCVREQTLDPKRYPSQVLCLSEQIRFKFFYSYNMLQIKIRFCSDVERCLSSTSVEQNIRTYRAQLSTQLEQFSASQITDSLVQLKLKALILDLVQFFWAFSVFSQRNLQIHHTDIVDQLLSSIVAGKEVKINVDSWVWQRQLRFYTSPTSGLVLVRQANSEFPYTYEYQVWPCVYKYH